MLAAAEMRSYSPYEKCSKSCDEDMVYAFATAAALDLCLHFAEFLDFTIFFVFDECHYFGVF